jgi:hypothetical protein
MMSRSSQKNAESDRLIWTEEIMAVHMNVVHER